MWPSPRDGADHVTSVLAYSLNYREFLFLTCELDVAVGLVGTHCPTTEGEGMENICNFGIFPK